MSTSAERGAAGPPALRFETTAPPDVQMPPPVSCVPDDALVVWEYERADLYRRMLPVVVGNRLELVVVTAGHEHGLRRVAGTRIVDGEGLATPQFLTRRALVFWGE